MTITVTGGAGYIGTHVVDRIRRSGREVSVVDDLSSGDSARVADAPFLRLDLADPAGIDRLAEHLVRTRSTAVVHLAARKDVAESVEDPARYYAENVGGLATVLAACRASGVRRLVFSSTAAVYGEGDDAPLVENDPLEPVNPYGRSKLVGEWMLADAARAFGLAATSLRFFNVVGASPLAADPTSESVVPRVLDRIALGLPPLIFGDDYPTPDGTCVRDFIDVADVADAHVSALDALYSARDRDHPRHPSGPRARTERAVAADTEAGRERSETNARPSPTPSPAATPGAPTPGHRVYNVGTGVGHSVAEIIAIAQAVTGWTAPPEVRARRSGDPARAVASADRIAAELGWRATRSLRESIESAWIARLAVDRVEETG